MCKLKKEILGIEKCILDANISNCDCVLKHLPSNYIRRTEQLNKMRVKLGLPVVDPFKPEV